jgi:hypothetical protein
MSSSNDDVALVIPFCVATAVHQIHRELVRRYGEEAPPISQIVEECLEDYELDPDIFE